MFLGSPVERRQIFIKCLVSADSEKHRPGTINSPQKDPPNNNKFQLEPCMYVYIYWLVVWNMFLSSIIYGMSSFPLTNSYFSEGLKLRRHTHLHVMLRPIHTCHIFQLLNPGHCIAFFQVKRPEGLRTYPLEDFGKRV